MEIELLNPYIQSNVSNASIYNIFPQPLIKILTFNVNFNLFPFEINSEKSLYDNIISLTNKIQLSSDYFYERNQKQLNGIYFFNNLDPKTMSNFSYLTVFELISLAILYLARNSDQRFNKFLEESFSIIEKLDLDKYTGKYINFPTINLNQQNYPQTLLIDWRPAIVGMVQQVAVNFDLQDILFSLFGGLVRTIAEQVYMFNAEKNNPNKTLSIIRLDKNRYLNAVCKRLENYGIKTITPYQLGKGS